ncbi:M23 family metallopeptidase [Nannocystaceae bacterium ST9]
MASPARLAALSISWFVFACGQGTDPNLTFGGSFEDEFGEDDPLPDLLEGDESGNSGSTSTTSDPGSTSTGEEGGVPMETTGDGDGDPGYSCSQYAAQQGWGTFYCDNGNGICSGAGVDSADCALCCQGPSCGEYAEQQGWDFANCEWNGNNACNGLGTPTYDCNHCCGGNSNDTDPTAGSTTGDGDGDIGGFGYPVGDTSSYPAGGWQVWQVLGHYWDAYGGRHMAQDVAAPGGGAATVNAPVYAVADGVVRYAGANASSYRNVVLIEHDDGQGGKICSFYGHTNPPLVGTGQQVTRGQQITTVRDWASCVDGGASSNTHLHYVLLSKPLCDASAASGGALICGYDDGGPSDVDTIAEEPYYYTAISDACGDWQYANSFVSPTKFIEDHHF